MGDYISKFTTGKQVDDKLDMAHEHSNFTVLNALTQDYINAVKAAVEISDEKTYGFTSSGALIEIDNTLSATTEVDKSSTFVWYGCLYNFLTGASVNSTEYFSTKALFNVAVGDKITINSGYKFIISVRGADGTFISTINQSVLEYTFTEACYVYITLKDNANACTVDTIYQNSGFKLVRSEKISVDIYGIIPKIVDGELKIYSQSEGDYVATGIKNQNAITDYTDKKWIMIGDSITENNNRASKHYYEYIAEWNGCIPQNYGKSGTGYMQAWSTNENFVNRLTSLPDDSEDIGFISVMGSFNDYGNIASNLGVFGDTGTTTLFGCIYNVLNGLINKYPCKPIFVVTPQPWSSRYGEGNNAANYVDAIIKTAHSLNIPVFDLYRYSNMRPWITANNTEYFTPDSGGAADGTHPNAAGHEVMAKLIYKFMRDVI